MIRLSYCTHRRGSLSRDNVQNAEHFLWLLNQRETEAWFVPLFQGHSGRGLATSDLNLFYELGLKFHRSDAIDLAVDVVVAVYKPDISDLCANFNHS